MAKIVWNGGFEMDWKTIAAIVGFIFLAGERWVEVLVMKENIRVNQGAIKTISATQTSDGWRIGSLEERIAFCCPLYHALPSDSPHHELRPKDLTIPPVGNGGRE